MFTELASLHVFVREFQKSIDFYKDVLELPLISKSKNLANFRVPGFQLILESIANQKDGEASNKVGQNTGICFQVKELEKQKEKLLAKDVHFLGEITADPDGNFRRVYFEDPNGNILALKQNTESKDNDIIELQTATPQLPASSILKTSRFYEEKLGFESLQILDDEKFLIVRRDDCEIHYWQAETEDVAREIAAASSCYIKTLNIQHLYQEYQSKGVNFRFGIKDQPWGMREMWIDDPDGNAIRFGELILEDETES